ncbi:hypothetical protein [Candidatus Poriferisodalis sp.]|uniref:hypothetical protein n=1 Tax=Candidatus Poriferisodalis sp. TaxID=3101277 RepID=UPI003B02B2AB
MRVAPRTAPTESAAQPDPDADGAPPEANSADELGSEFSGDWIRADRSLSWIRRLGPLLRRQRARIVVAVIAAILATGAGAIAPWIAGLAVDAAVTGLEGAGSGSLWAFVIALVGLGAARGIFTYAYRYGLFSMGHRVEFQLRTLLFSHLSSCRSRSTTGCRPARSSPAPTPTSARCRCIWLSRRLCRCSS